MCYKEGKGWDNRGMCYKEGKGWDNRGMWDNRGNVLCCTVKGRVNRYVLCVVYDVGLLEEPAEGDSDVMNLLSSLQGIVLSLPFFHLSTTYPHTV